MTELLKGTKLHGRYLELEPRANGLIVRLTDEGREAVADFDQDSDERAIDYRLFADLFEDFRCNSDWEMLGPEQIGALTDCQIILSPEVVYDDDGDVVECETVYWHERYAIEDAIAALQAGELFLAKGN